MSLARETIRSLHGVWRILLRDPAAMSYFNTSLEGYWRSFFAAVLILPFYVYLVQVDAAVSGKAVADPFRRWLIEASAYALQWTLWPLIAFHATKRIGCGDRYVHYIVAYNWAQPILFVPFFLLIGFVMPNSKAIAAQFYGLVWLAVVAFEWFLTWKVLQISALRAAGLYGICLLQHIVLISAGDFVKGV